MTNCSLWGDIHVVLEKEVTFIGFDFETSDVEFEISKSSIWKRTTPCGTVWKGCFFFHYYLPTLITDWAQIFTGLLFYAYVEIHKVRRLVFDNYQYCPVFLKALDTFGNCQQTSILTWCISTYATNNKSVKILTG